ncbi:hypothetical protein [Natrinema altunense]|uniref:hypothetical protein n=1 Tax=Natrinema altunense TaxID=222984 RepID=UPI001186B558|nr:hypothetical protein [Natrinema altunense]
MSYALEDKCQRCGNEDAPVDLVSSDPELIVNLCVTCRKKLDNWLQGKLEMKKSPTDSSDKTGKEEGE